MATTMELAWAAGLMEGEGSFGIQKQSSGRYARVQLTMTDEDVVRHFAEVMGGRVYGPYRPSDDRPHWKPRWHWTVNGHEAAGVMMTLYPLLGIRRQLAIREALAHWKAQPVLSGEHRLACKNGHPWAIYGRVRPMDVKHNAGTKYCIECSRLSMQRARERRRLSAS